MHDLSYAALEDAFLTLEIKHHPAMIHAMLAALLAVNIDLREEAWTDALLHRHIEPIDFKARKAYEMLLNLFKATQQAFAHNDYAFALLLPPDEAPLEERVKSLAAWAQGFLAALNLLGVQSQGHADADAQKAIDDLIATSKLKLTGIKAHDADIEARLPQLVEQMRLSVQHLVNLLRESGRV